MGSILLIIGGPAAAFGIVADAAPRLASDGWLVIDTTELAVDEVVDRILAEAPGAEVGIPRPGR